MKVASMHPNAVAQSWDLVMVGTPDLADVKLRALLFLLTVSAPEDTGPRAGGGGAGRGALHTDEVDVSSSEGRGSWFSTPRIRL